MDALQVFSPFHGPKTDRLVGVRQELLGVARDKRVKLGTNK